MKGKSTQKARRGARSWGESSSELCLLLPWGEICLDKMALQRAVLALLA